MTDVLDRIRARQSVQSDIPIEVPEWGLKAFIRPLSAGKMANLQKLGNAARMAVSGIIWGIVDKDGNPVFKDDAPTMALLLDEHHSVIDRVSSEIIRADIKDGTDAKNS